MDLFRKFCLSFICFLPILTHADDTVYTAKNSYSVGLDIGGARPTQLGNSASFPLGYSTFSYFPSNNNDNATIYGISFNKIFSIAPLYSVQVGASYHHLSNMDVQGILMQGISPPYYQANYSYKIYSTQYLIDAKLRRQFYTRFFPYLYLGLGVASNRASNFTTNVPAYLTVTPNYSDNTLRSFSYSLGAGIDFMIMPQLSVGLGYRFINLGKTGLGTGVIRNTAVKAALTQSNFYLNSLMAQLNLYI